MRTVLLLMLLALPELAAAQVCGNHIKDVESGLQREFDRVHSNGQSDTVDVPVSYKSSSGARKQEVYQYTFTWPAPALRVDDSRTLGYRKATGALACEFRIAIMVRGTPMVHGNVALDLSISDSGRVLRFVESPTQPEMSVGKLFIEASRVGPMYYGRSAADIGEHFSKDPKVQAAAEQYFRGKEAEAAREAVRQEEAKKTAALEAKRREDDLLTARAAELRRLWLQYKGNLTKFQTLLGDLRKCADRQIANRARPETFCDGDGLLWRAYYAKEFSYPSADTRRQLFFHTKNAVEAWVKNTDQSEDHRLYSEVREYTTQMRTAAQDAEFSDPPSFLQPEPIGQNPENSLDGNTTGASVTSLTRPTSSSNQSNEITATQAENLVASTAKPYPRLTGATDVYSGTYSCGRYLGQGSDPAYGGRSNQVTMEIVGGNALLKIKTRDFEETLRGSVSGGVMALAGDGYWYTMSARVRAWTTHLNGEFSGDFATYAATGGHFGSVSGKVRECELNLRRSIQN